MKEVRLTSAIFPLIRLQARDCLRDLGRGGQALFTPNPMDGYAPDDPDQ